MTSTPRGDPNARASWSVRAALTAGFAVVFGLWLLWGYQLAHSLQRLEQSVSEVRESYVRSEQTLATVRTNVLLGSIYLRDAIIDGAAAERDRYRGEFTRLRTEVERQLQSVPAGAATVERERWANLQTALDEYWLSRESVFDADARGEGEGARQLKGRLAPRRDAVLTILDDLSELQRETSQRHELEANSLYRQARTRLISIGAVTLLVALVAAFAVARHANYLQRQIERQQLGERQSRQDLQRLSARLVDAQEEERRTLARELHDEVGQALTAVKIDIGIALRGGDERRSKTALLEARGIAESTLRSVRDLSQLLHPSVLDDFGLSSALSAYLLSFARRTGIRVHLTDTIEARLAPPVEVCVYRLAQEALNNVAQHSHATECTVSLRVEGGEVRLAIEDNGRGLGQQGDSRPIRGGLGLIGMRERAQAVGGALVIDDRPGGGTRVDVSLPFQPATPQADASQRLAG